MKPFNLLLPTILSLTRSSGAHSTGASPSGVSLHATVQIAPENVTSFLEWGKQIVAVVTAEPLCHFFELYQSIEDPGVISWVENWDATVEWLVHVQLPKEYYKEYLEATEPMYIKPREMRIINRAGSPFAFYKSWNQEQA
ncbi:hypothetical protein OQA88_10270 [Cercophora sp. LCS_1]